MSREVKPKAAEDPFKAGVVFNFDFGPTIKEVLQNGKRLELPEIPSNFPTWSTVAFEKEVIGQTDTEKVLEAIRAETVATCQELAGYIASPEFTELFYRQLAVAVSAYRGTVLKIGTDNRAQRRADQRTPEEKVQSALDRVDPFRVDL